MKRIFVMLGLLGAVLLTGCSATTFDNKEYFENDGRNFFESLKKQPSKAQENDNDEFKNVIKVKQTYVAKVENKTEGTVGLKLNKETQSAVEEFDFKPSRFSKGHFTHDSAACRYLRTSSDVEASIVGSPTLSASSDDDGAGSVSIGMNLLDLKKAKLIRSTGDARCRMQTASKQIEATLGLGQEAAKFAGFYAKQAHIRNNLKQLNAVKSRANHLVSTGIITSQDANFIALRIRELRSAMELAKAEADKRQDLPALDINNLRSRHGALVEATNDLQNIEREIRTNDALELSVSTGYRYNNEFNNTLQSNNSEGSFARVNVGVRLGALTKKRHRLEEEAAGARIDALFEENTGTIWKSGFAEKAINRMILDLQKSEKELVAGVANANDTIYRLENTDRADIVRAKLQTKIQKVSIESDLASVRATIKQLKDNRAKIRSLSD